MGTKHVTEIRTHSKTFKWIELRLLTVFKNDFQCFSLYFLIYINIYICVKFVYCDCFNVKY